MPIIRHREREARRGSSKSVQRPATTTVGWTETPDNVQKSCVLCGQAATSHSGHTDKSWSAWKSDCAQSLCSLASLSVDAFQSALDNGPYCIQCSRKIWDIHFTMKQIKALELRLQSLKGDMEDKLKNFCNKIPQSKSRLKNTSEPRPSKRHEAEPDKVAHRFREIAKELRATTETVTTSREDNDHNDEPMPVSPQTPESETAEPEIGPFSPTPESPEPSQSLIDLDLDPFVTVKEEEEEMEDRCGDTDANYELDPLDLAKLDERKSKASETGDWDSDFSDPEWAPSFVKASAKRKLDGGRVRKGGGDACGAEDKLKARKRKISGSSGPKKPSHPCPVCATTCRGPFALKKHMQQKHRGHIFDCAHCPAKYRKRALLEKHRKDKHGDTFPFPCTTPNCRKGFQTQDELAVHKEEHNNGRTGPFNCLICDKSFPRPSKLDRHLSSHSTPLQCVFPGCGRNFTTKTSLRWHSTTHTRSLACETCGRICSTAKTLSNHRKRHTLERNFVCHICPKTFKADEDLGRHLKVHNIGTSYPCTICGKILHTPYLLKRHEETHLLSKTYVCATCGKVFRTKNAIYTHERQMHNPLFDKVKRRMRVEAWRENRNKAKAEELQHEVTPDDPGPDLGLGPSKHEPGSTEGSPQNLDPVFEIQVFDTSSVTLTE